MTKFEIKITDMETEEVRDIDTDGYLLLSLEQSKVKISGKMDLSALAPILTRIALEKMSQK